MPKNVTTDTINITSLEPIDTITLSNMGSGYTIGGNATPVYTIGSINNLSSTTGTSYTWNTPTSVDWTNTIISNGTGLGANIRPSGQIQLNGVDADIKVNGRSLMDAITALEERLNILVPNPELEKEWEELRELGEQYRKLEQKCKEKGEMWNKLKQMPPPKAE